MRVSIAILVLPLLGLGLWACGGGSSGGLHSPSGQGFTKADLCCGGACGTPPGYCCTGVCCPGKQIWHGPKWKIGDPVPDPAEAAKAAQ